MISMLSIRKRKVITASHYTFINGTYRIARFLPFKKSIISLFCLTQAINLLIIFQKQAINLLIIFQKLISFEIHLSSRDTCRCCFYTYIYMHAVLSQQFHTEILSDDFMTYSILYRNLLKIQSPL